jgi:hypothetical protein
MIYRLWALLTLLLFSIAPVQRQIPVVTSQVRAITSAISQAARVGLYEKFELEVELDAEFNNPYDPDDIRLDAEFESPSGQLATVPGFYYRDFAVDQNNTFAPGEDSWRVRFTPWEVGEWRYRLVAATTTSHVSGDWESLRVDPSDRAGFIRLDERNPRYLAFDNGTPYFAVGENMAWSTGNVLEDYTAWLDALSAAGGNFIRLWMASWGFGIEWNDTGLGNYGERQWRAYLLDRVFEMAAERDVYIMLSLLNHGAFSLTTNSEWDTNPYNVANGGMLQAPQEFATNPEAIRLWHRRLRYIAARWGYSPNLMAWEWWNEVNWTPMAGGRILAPWMESSADVLRSFDPYGHLITHSGSTLADRSVWELESIRFTQDHRYDMPDLMRSFANIIPDWLAAYPDKPFLMGEFGASAPSQFDLEGVLLHLGLWSPPMHGSFGTGMMWWWDNYIHPNDLYHQFTPVAAFFGSEDLAARAWQPTQAELDENSEARLFGLQAEDAALLWIVSRGYNENALMRQYERNLRNGVENPLAIEYPTNENVVLTVTALVPGAYTVEIWDAQTGTVLETQDVQTADGTFTVALPPFERDLALKIKP